MILNKRELRLNLMKNESEGYPIRRERERVELLNERREDGRLNPKLTKNHIKLEVTYTHHMWQFIG